MENCTEQLLEIKNEIFHDSKYVVLYDFLSAYLTSIESWLLSLLIDYEDKAYHSDPELFAENHKFFKYDMDNIRERCNQEVEDIQSSINTLTKLKLIQVDADYIKLNRDEINKILYAYEKAKSKFKHCGIRLFLFRMHWNLFKDNLADWRFHIKYAKKALIE